MDQILALFSNPYVGLGIICLIIYITFYSIQQSLALKKFYNTMTAEVKENKEGNREEFTNEVLKKIHQQFLEILKRGTEYTNTQVVIEGNLPQDKVVLYSKLNFFKNLVVILGLLGTFLGLTGVVASMSNVFSSLNTLDIKIFIQELTPAMTSMKSAFLTSVFGLMSSATLNYFYISTKQRAKEGFLDEIEDYLDNYLYPKHVHNHSNAVYEFTKTVETKLDEMTERITKTFDEGIDRIEFVKVDLQNTTDVLNNAVDKMDISINNFRDPVNQFRGSIDKFERLYEGTGVNIQQIKNIVEDLKLHFNATIDAFRRNEENLVAMGDSLSESVHKLNNSYDRLRNLVEDIKTTSQLNEDRMKSVLVAVEEVNKEINSSILLLNGAIKDMSTETANQLSRAFYQQADSTTEKLVEKMEQISDTNGKINDYFEKNLDKMGETIKSVNEMIVEVSKAKTYDKDPIRNPYEEIAAEADGHEI